MKINLNPLKTGLKFYRSLKFLDIFYKNRVIFNPVSQKNYRFVPELVPNYNHYIWRIYDSGLWSSSVTGRKFM